MTARLSAVPIVADWSTTQNSSECGCNALNCYSADQKIGSDAKFLQWKDATVEEEDREFGEGDAAKICFLHKKSNLERSGTT